MPTTSTLQHAPYYYYYTPLQVRLCNHRGRCLLLHAASRGGPERHGAPWAELSGLRPVLHALSPVLLPPRCLCSAGWNPVLQALSPTSSFVLHALSPVLHTLSPVLHALSPVLHTLSPVLHTLSPVLHTLSPLLQAQRCRG
eukprot:scaffold131408_cov37-Phaeocystis_antarctica.AAC.1